MMVTITEFDTVTVAKTKRLERSVMAKLAISVDDKYFKSDSIIRGRLVRRFFEALTTNVFKQSYRFWEESKTLTGADELPLLYGERNLYSIFASAIDKVTPIHLSEWSFSNSDEEVDSRRVDFWCLNRDSDHGQRINYFIELKKAGYCLSAGTRKSFTATTESKIRELSDQVIALKKLRPQWDGDGDVFLGIIVIHGYHSGKSGFDETQVRDNIHATLDNRLKAQLIISTWTLPEAMGVQWEKSKCQFVSIAGIVVTKAK